jgi:hypothetical protein
MAASFRYTSKLLFRRMTLHARHSCCNARLLCICSERRSDSMFAAIPDGQTSYSVEVSGPLRPSSFFAGFAGFAVRGKTRGRFEMRASDSVVSVGPTRLREKSSVDAERLAADERSAIAEKKFHGRGDVVGCTDAAQRSKTCP